MRKILFLSIKIIFNVAQNSIAKRQNSIALVFFVCLSQFLFGVAYFISTPFDETEVPNLQYAQADNEMYLVSGTDIPQVLTRTAHNAWTITDMTMEDGPFQPLNTTTTTITPSNDLAVGDTVTLTASSSIFQSTAGASHIGSIWQIDQKRPNVFQGAIDADESSAATYFFKGNYSFITEGTWDGTITLERSTTGAFAGEETAALSALTDTNFDNPQETEPDGAYYRVTGSGWTSGTCNYTLTITDAYNHGIVSITGVASGTSATGTVITAIYDTSATTRWREGFWSDYRGWPKTVAFHQQRLVFGGSTSYPQALWFGKQDPDEYYNFSEGTVDTAAFTVYLQGQNPIRWLLSGDYLFIGTSGSTGKYGEAGQAVTPTSPAYSEQSQYGSDSIMAVYAGDTVLYVERGSRKVREFQYSLQYDKFLTPDLTLLAEDITGTGIKEIAFQARPYPILWCVLDDGDVATLTYQREQSVYAWSKQTTDGNFESVATIPGTGSEDEVWFVVKRTINGTDYRYVEQLQPFDWGSDDNDAWFVDCGYGYDSTPITTLTNLSWLEAETVQIYGDGTVLTDDVVEAGTIVFTSSSRVITGLPYTAKLETMPIVIDPRDLTYQKKIMNLWVDLYKTGDISYGMGPSSTVTPVSLSGITTSSVALEEYRFVYGSRGKPTIYLESEEPLPLTIRALVPEIRPYKQD